jgi:uncharacterized membrane protein
MARFVTRNSVSWPLRRPGRAWARHQKGAFGLMAAFTLLTAIAFAALSLDAGRLWLERRGVQRAADMASIAAARFIGCGTNSGDALTAAKEAATNNGADPSTVKVVYGTVSRNGGNALVFTPGATSESADAVQVTLSKSVTKSLLLGGATSGSVLIPAVSTAKGHAPVGSFSINSVNGINQSMADATSGLFGAILGTSNLKLAPADLSGLLKESVSLTELMNVSPQYTSVNAMLNQTVTLQTMLKRIASANSNIASNAAFKAILAASVSRPLVFITLGNVINIHMVTNASGMLDTTVGVKEARINVLDLILTGVQVTGYKGGGLFNFGINGIFVFGVEMFSAPQLALGPAGMGQDGKWCTTALSSDVSVKVGIDLSWLLGLADIILRVDAGTVEGHLSSVNIKPVGITGNVAAQNAAVTLVLTNHNDVNKPIIPDTFGPAKILGGLVGLKIYQPILAAKSVNTSFNLASKYDLPTAVKLGAGTAGQSLAGLLGDKSIIEVSIFWNLFKLRVDFLDDLVSFVMAPLGALLDGLLALFGIQTGNAYLQMRTIEMMPPALLGSGG